MANSGPGDDNPRSSLLPRPSIYDVCLQLGALDENSVINQWMFSNGASTNASRRSRHFNGNTRFKEVISQATFPGHDDEPAKNIPQTSRFGIFSSLGFRSKGKRQSSTPAGQALAPIAEGTDSQGNRPTSSSPPPPRRSLFRRSSTTKSDRRTLNRTSSFVRDSGYNSVKSRSFFKRKTTADSGRIATPPQLDTSFEVNELGENPHTGLPTPKASPKTSPLTVRPSSTETPPQRSTTASPNPQLPTIHDDDGDEDWEEVEPITDSPMWSLQNVGINPPPLHPSPKKRFSFRPSSRLSTITDESTSEVKRVTHYSFSQALPRLVFGRQSSTSTADDRRPRSRLSKQPPASPTTPSTRNHKGLTINTDNLPKSTTSLVDPSSPPPQCRPTSLSLPSPPTPGLLKSLPPTPGALIPITPSVSGTGSGKSSSRIVFADTGLATPDRTPPMRMREMTPIEAAAKSNMGYHNQFFVAAQQAQAGKKPRTISAGSSTRKIVRKRGSRNLATPSPRPVPFPSTDED